MRSVAAVTTLLSAFAFLASSAVWAAELPLQGGVVQQRTVPHHRYRLGCSSYSCVNLYGAYGPWGGRAYWAEYSPVYVTQEVILRRAY